MLPRQPPDVALGGKAAVGKHVNRLGSSRNQKRKPTERSRFAELLSTLDVVCKRHRVTVELSGRDRFTVVPQRLKVDGSDDMELEEGSSGEGFACLRIC